MSCQKIRYATRKDANEFAREITRLTDARKQRAYLCRECNCWHLTSQAPADARRARRRYRQRDGG